MFYYSLNNVYISQRVLATIDAYIFFLVASHLNEYKYEPIITEPLLIDYGGIARIIFVFETKEHRLSVPANEWRPIQEIVHIYEAKIQPDSTISSAKDLCTIFNDNGVLGMVCICNNDNNEPTLLLKINDLISDINDKPKIASNGILFELRKIKNTPTYCDKEWVTITKFLEK